MTSCHHREPTGSVLFKCEYCSSIVYIFILNVVVDERMEVIKGGQSLGWPEEKNENARE